MNRLTLLNDAETQAAFLFLRPARNRFCHYLPGGFLFLVLFVVFSLTLSPINIHAGN